MIPRHRPPFGPLALLGLGVRSVFRSADVRNLEADYARMLNVPHAVWLPSARYGITRAIQLVTPQDGSVCCPVFNCGAVHHAVHETGRAVRFVDCQAGRFLMRGDLQADRIQCLPSSAIVLSEMFGHRFLPSDLQQPLIARAGLRIFDMAMAIPTAADMQRLTGSDLAVMSFGLGKSLYAGWGGMALTQCGDLADDLRRCRARDLRTFSRPARVRSFLSMLARTVAHEPYLYGHLRRRNAAGRAHTSDTFDTASHEWHRPPTPQHLELAAANFAVVTRAADQRIRLADVYRHNLPPAVLNAESDERSDTALSHFSIRVPGHVRESVRTALWDHGTDAGTLFPFPHHLVSDADYPNAATAAKEVLNLPLSCQLEVDDVLRICECVARATDAVDCRPAPCQQPAAA